jgi:hypothetical protein
LDKYDRWNIQKSNFSILAVKKLPADGYHCQAWIKPAEIGLKNLEKQKALEIRQFSKPFCIEQ